MLSRGPASTAVSPSCVSMNTDENLWTPDDVASWLGVARSSVDRWRQSDPHFPTPIVLSTRAVRFDPEDVRTWALSKQPHRRSERRGGRPAKPVRAY